MRFNRRLAEREPLALSFIHLKRHIAGPRGKERTPVTRPTILSVLLMVMCTPTFAAPSAGHWSTGMTLDKSSIYAATTNDDGFVFGQYCFFSSKTCSWHVVLDMGCDNNATYPVLASTDKGASTFELKCVGKLDASHYEYVFTNWKELESLLDKGERLGIVTPLQSDQFRVYRFLLDGLTEMKQEEEGAFVAATKPNNISPKKVSNTTSETL